MTFRHELADTVKLKHSGETGEIRARAEYLHSNDAYLITYKAADGRQVTEWWCEDLIEATS